MNDRTTAFSDIKLRLESIVEGVKVSELIPFSQNMDYAHIHWQQTVIGIIFPFRRYISFQKDKVESSYLSNVNTQLREFGIFVDTYEGEKPRIPILWEDAA